MPKDEFDFEDPFELNGMAILTHEDTTDNMAECFTEEFMRMGYGNKQILALFKNPHYLGPNMAFEKRGEPFIRELITEVFARWGRNASWGGAANDTDLEVERASEPQIHHPEVEESVETDPMGAPVPKLNV
jgi:hypothetical protein